MSIRPMGHHHLSPRLKCHKEQSLDLYSNGGIVVRLPAGLQNACWLDASSSFGAIKTDLEGSTTLKRTLGYNWVQAETKGYAVETTRSHICGLATGYIRGEGVAGGAMEKEVIL